MSLSDLPKSITKFAEFENVSNDIDEMFKNPNIYNGLLEYVLDADFPKSPVRKNQIVLDFKTLSVFQESERLSTDEKTPYMNKFNSDYIAYHLNSIVSEENELRMTTYDLKVLDFYYESLKNKRYGFLPLTVHARDTPNSNFHYLLVILDYTTKKYYLFDSRNTNDYLYRSKNLPRDALEQLMMGLAQFKPFEAPFEYVPMASWIGPQLQNVIHRNKWDSIYSLAWCLFIAMWLDESPTVNPETIMIELNNSAVELDKQNFIHTFIKQVLTKYKTRNDPVDEKKTNLSENQVTDDINEDKNIKTFCINMDCVDLNCCKGCGKDKCEHCDNYEDEEPEDEEPEDEEPEDEEPEDEEPEDNKVESEDEDDEFENTDAEGGKCNLM